MLRIRAKQMALVNEASAAAFHWRLVTFLRKEIKDAASLSDDELLERIFEGERRAAQYIESEAGIAQFVCLTFAVGLMFDEIPEVRALLQQSQFSAEEKLDELINYLDALEDNPQTNHLEMLLESSDTD